MAILMMTSSKSFVTAESKLITSILTDTMILQESYTSLKHECTAGMDAILQVRPSGCPRKRELLPILVSDYPDGPHCCSE